MGTERIFKSLKTTLSDNVKIHACHCTFAQSCAYVGPYLNVNDDLGVVKFQY